MQTAKDSSLTNLFDVERIRQDFPTISPDTIYLDSLASSLTPFPVIEAMTEYYTKHCANVHWGTYDLSLQAPEQFQHAIANIARFIGAQPEEVVVTSNATQALNEIAMTLNFAPGDEVLISSIEHSSNILPWMRLVETNGIKMQWYKTGKSGHFDMEQFEQCLTPKTRLVSFTYVSSVVGSIVPVEEVGKLCHERNIRFLVDASQAVPHLPIDVKRIDCDFMVFSGHKMLGPTGVGIMYMKLDMAKTLLPAFMGGGTLDTSACSCTSLDTCSIDDCTFSDLPLKWSVGTPPIAEMLGLSAAVDYLNAIGFEAIQRHEAQLMRRAHTGLLTIPGIELFGPEKPEERCSILSFNIGTLPPFEVGRMLHEQFQIAVRGGDHCVIKYYRDEEERGLLPKGNVRASFYLYNTEEEVDRFLSAIETIARTCL